MSSQKIISSRRGVKTPKTDTSQIDLDLFTQAMVTTAVTSDLHPSQTLQILCGLIRETTLSL